MKKLILIAVVLFVGLGLYSQNKIAIRKTDGTLDSYLMTSVDSIYHNLSEDTMKVRNSDGLFSFALSEVDSVYFKTVVASCNITGANEITQGTTSDYTITTISDGVINWSSTDKITSIDGNGKASTTAEDCGVGSVVATIAESDYYLSATCNKPVDVVGCSPTYSLGQVKGAGTTVYTFMNYNLGADNTADPLTPDRKLNGAYYQWGRKDSVAYAPTATDDNPGIVGTWDGSNAPNDSWKDDEKTANDPCPSGFKVPTKDVWQEVKDNNTWTAVGTWNDSSSNYSAGYEIKPDGTNTTMFLPASGTRRGNDGDLGRRGSQGNYWSSTQRGADDGYFLTFYSSEVIEHYIHRSTGYSVRCLAE